MTSPQPRPLVEQRLVWALFALALAAAVVLVRRAPRHAAVDQKAFDLLDAVPAGPELLVTAELGKLSPAVALELLRGGGASLLGLRELCGFEPLLALRHVAFATKASADARESADFALIAQTSLEPDAVVRCAEAVIRDRGGQPARSALGAFTSVRDLRKPVGEVAMRGDGLFVLSGGRYFRDVIDAASGASLGDEAARVRSGVHARLRTRLAPGQLLLTLIPGRDLPLPGVRALGLALDVQRQVALRGFVGCASPEACGEAQRLLTRLLGDVAKDSGIPELEKLEVRARGVELDVIGTLPQRQLGPLLTQLLAP